MEPFFFFSSKRLSACWDMKRVLYLTTTFFFTSIRNENLKSIARVPNAHVLCYFKRLCFIQV